MKNKEFWFSVLASIVAAALLEAAGFTSWLPALKSPTTVPVWSLLTLAVTPIALAVIWFRRYVSPAHSQAVLDLTQAQTVLKLRVAEVEELRTQVTTLQVAAGQAADREAKITEQLDHWKKRGTIIYPDDTEIVEIAGKRFGPEVVDMDNRRFVHCVFEGTILRYRGIGPVQFDSDTFADIRWVFDGPVGNAFALLRAMYGSGVPEMADQLNRFLESLRVAPEVRRPPGAPGAR